ncbi:hypothetical protein Egran_05736 [Elaphomyces granulatus]|uniref:Uncharacterized protein n=1 Tax=Elaphomyces granulatus TaxID=519963 RepID=A0A232LRR8_9EURO|nr:hypothetical protein Egran_05736 [Elaphomyces granulatus]
MSPPNTSPSSSPPMSPGAIVAPMTPTGASPRPTPTIRIPADLHDAKSDLDPTEWKPIIPTCNGSSASLASSEAWTYLSNFHGGDEAMLASRRGRGHRSLWALSNAHGAIPSLSHTPTSVASSFNSNSDGFMYDFANRPLPPRHNPSFTTSTVTSKGVELVMPHAQLPSLDVTAVIESRTESQDGGSLWGTSDVKSPTPVSFSSTFGPVDTSAEN